jgi:outer membrane protein assembly factor BamB
MRQIALALLATTLAPFAQAAPAAKILWSTSVNQSVYTAPQEQAGAIYLTSTQPTGPNVFAIDSASGKVLWSFATQGAVSIPPTIGKTQVFVASDIGATHYLRAIDAKTGQLVWAYTRSQPPECMCSQPAILSGDLLFAQSDGHSLYAFAPNGLAPSKRLWQFPGDGAPLSSPVAAGADVILTSADHNVYALNAKTGAVRWSGTSGYVFTAAPLVESGVVIAGDQGGNMDGFDLATGKQLWSNAAGPIDNAAVADKTNAYIASEDHSIYALDLHSGNQAWQFSMDDYTAYSPLLAGGLVIAANRAGELVAIDPATGKLAWQTALDGVPFSQPVFWPQSNAVVFKIGDHEIAAFDAKTGKQLWRYNSALVLTTPVTDGNHVSVATSSGQVVALN